MIENMKAKVPPHNKDSKELNQSEQKISQSEVRKVLKGDFGENRRSEMENNFISKGEFEQYEKRIDERFNNLNSKIDALPKTFEDKLEIALNRRAEKEREERKKDKHAIIGWTISGFGVIIALIKAFGWI